MCVCVCVCVCVCCEEEEEEAAAEDAGDQGLADALKDAAEEKERAGERESAQKEEDSERQEGGGGGAGGRVIRALAASVKGLGGEGRRERGRERGPGREDSSVEEEEETAADEVGKEEVRVDARGVQRPELRESIAKSRSAGEMLEERDVGAFSLKHTHTDATRTTGGSVQWGYIGPNGPCVSCPVAPYMT